MNFSNNDPNQDGLKDAFENIRADSESSDELFFDPATGELRSARNDDDSDRVPATQMAREGFFLREGDGALDQCPLHGELPAATPASADLPIRRLRPARSKASPRSWSSMAKPVSSKPPAASRLRTGCRPRRWLGRGSSRAIRQGAWRRTRGHVPVPALSIAA